MGGISFAPIPGTDGKYVADSEGNVYGPKGKRRPVRMFSKSGPNAGQCHSRVSMWVGGRHRNLSVHRAVFAAFHGEIPDGLLVRHTDGDSQNNALANLAVGTQADNIADRRRHGRGMAGSANPAARLTTEDVTELRAWHATGGVTYAEIASWYGVSAQTVGRAVRGQSWKGE